MSKLACRCGNVISDILCPSPTNGELVGDQDDDRLQSEALAAVGEFVAALRAGRRAEWLGGFFLKGYPDDLSDESVISDILSYFEGRYRKSMAECNRCGRLWVQVRTGENVYRSYSPDDGGYAAVLLGGPDVNNKRPLRWTGPAQQT